MTRVHEAMRHAGKIGEPVQQSHQSADFVVKESATEALSAHESGKDTKRPAAPRHQDRPPGLRRAVHLPRLPKVSPSV